MDWRHKAAATHLFNGVLEGASFTSYREKNPTLTVTAVAIRDSDHLAEALRTVEE